MSPGSCLSLPLGYTYMYEIKQILRQKGSFWNWYKMMEIIKALKCCQNLYQVVVCSCLGDIYSLKFRKSAKSLSLPRTRYRVSVTGPLVLWFHICNKSNMYENNSKLPIVSPLWGRMGLSQLHCIIALLFS